MLPSRPSRIRGVRMTGWAMRASLRRQLLENSWVVVAAVAFVTPAIAKPTEGDAAFGCGGGAVDVQLDRSPGLHFVRLNGLPTLRAPLVFHYPFAFGKGKLSSVVIHIVSNGPEDGVWYRAANADFELYAETTRRSGNRGAEVRECWKLVEPPRETRSVYDEGIALSFHGGRDGAPISVLLAASPHVPILHATYSQDLGGANADNWTVNDLLLDFRHATPRIVATTECGYNEGGGACTAIDSGEMSRSNLQCSWRSAVHDFLCSETMDGPSGHRDSYLLNEHRVPPLRSGEVATMADAIVRLRAQPSLRAVVVRQAGPVHLVHDLKLPSGLHLIILGSPGRLHAVPVTNARLGRPVNIEPKALPGDERHASETPSPGSSDGGGWTLERSTSFSAGVLQRSGALFVLQIVAHDGDFRSLIWLGIEDRNTAPVLDALTVATESQTYIQCGRYHFAPAVVAVRAIERPFRALVDVQPTASTGHQDGLVWGTEWRSEGDARAIDCLRRGEIRWISGKGFDATVDAPRSSDPPTQPRYVRIDDTGKVTLSTEAPPPPEAP